MPFVKSQEVSTLCSFRALEIQIVAPDWVAMGIFRRPLAAIFVRCCSESGISAPSLVDVHAYGEQHKNEARG